VWLRVREDWNLGGVVLLGLAGGLMAMVREQDLLFVAGPAIDFLRQAMVARRRPDVPVALAGVAAFALAFLPQLFAYKALNGHFGPSIYVSRKMTWTAPHALGVLFDPAHGFLMWTPLALVALVGLTLVAARKLFRDRPDAAWIATLALAMIALQVYVSGSVESWTVAGSFGQRRFVATTPLLTLGIAALIGGVATRPARSLLAVVIALSLWWNLALMLLFGTHRMDRQGLTLAENARAAFLELPFEAPGLAWRYVTDRASFYQQPRQ
jgi:hypothetical protein